MNQNVFKIGKINDTVKQYLERKKLSIINKETESYQFQSFKI